MTNRMLSVFVLLLSALKCMPSHHSSDQYSVIKQRFLHTKPLKTAYDQRKSCLITLNDWAAFGCKQYKIYLKQLENYLRVSRKCEERPDILEPPPFCLRCPQISLKGPPSITLFAKRICTFYAPSRNLCIIMPKLAYLLKVLQLQWRYVSFANPLKGFENSQCNYKMISKNIFQNFVVDFLQLKLQSKVFCCQP